MGLKSPCWQGWFLLGETHVLALPSLRRHPRSLAWGLPPTSQPRTSGRVLSSLVLWLPSRPSSSFKESGEDTSPDHLGTSS